MPSLRLLAPLVSSLLVAASPVAAQSLGTFRWQLQPYCNVLTVSLTQQDGLFRLEGADDLCGAPRVAQLTGLAVSNGDGTIGLGLTIIETPSGLPVHVSAVVNPSTLSGSWRDASGNAGAFEFTSGAALPGAPRPAPTRTTTAIEWQQGPGGPQRGIVARASDVTDPRGGGAAIFGQWGAPALDIPLGQAGVRGESAGAAGVLGVSDYGPGVFGFSEAGQGVLGVSRGSIGIRATSQFGVGLLAQSGPSARATALQIDGAIKVAGWAPAPAFRHVATAATISGSDTVLTHPLLDGDANALVYVTAVDDGVAMTAPIGVSYAASQWRIVTRDHSPMPAGAAFNVLVIKR